MPRTRLLALIAALAATVAASPFADTTALAADPTVVVRPGDSLTAIARRTGVPLSRLVELNRLPNANRIYAGQRLRIGRERAPRRAPSRAPAPRVVVVPPGATVWQIALRYGTSVAAIADANRLVDPSVVFAGQRLVIPGTRVRAADRPSPRASSARRHAATEHVVARGEYLSRIAAAYGVTVDAIARANAISNPSRIFAGQRLVIPGVQRARAPRTGRASVPASMAQTMARRNEVRRLIVDAADAYRVPRAFALAVAWQESGWQQGVVSHAGAVGVMQLMPATAVWVGDAMLGRPVRIHDTRSNVHAGVRLLRHYLDRYGGNRDMVLAAYYQGQRAVDLHGIYAVSRPYIASIRNLERLLGG